MIKLVVSFQEIENNVSNILTNPPIVWYTIYKRVKKTMSTIIYKTMLILTEEKDES